MLRTLISLSKSLGHVSLWLVITLSAFACQTPDVNESIYGKWHEPVEGEGIELRADGVAFWYGEEGRFEVTVSRVDTLLCGLSVLGCYFGDVQITIEDRVYQTRYYDRRLAENTDAWSMTFDDPVSVPSGRLVKTLRMQRVDQLTGPQTRPGFTRMDEGLEDYYTGDGTLYEISDRWVRHRYNSEAGEPDLHLWSDEDERWTLIELAEPQDSRNFIMGASLIYATDGYYSRDAGVTFAQAPSISDLPVDFEEHKTVALGSELISLLHINGEDDEVRSEVWGLDLDSDRPTWTRRHRFAEADSLAYLLAAPNADALIISWLNEEGPIRSLDGGRTWTQIHVEEIPCEDNNLVNTHPMGCWCATQEDRYVYDARHDRWMTLSRGGWSNQGVGNTQASLADDYPLFVVEANRLFLVDWSGARTPTVRLPDDLDGWRLYVASGRLIYPHYLLWSAPFEWLP